MPVAHAGGAFAEPAHGDVLPAQVLERQRSARGHRNGGGQRADNGHDVELEVAHVHGQNAASRHASDEVGGHIAMGGKQDVAGVGLKRGAGGNGLLAAAHVHAAHNLALAVELALDAVLHLAHQAHVIEALMRKGGLLAPACGNSLRRAHPELPNALSLSR